MDLFAHPHRRYNPLTGEWILVSPQRTSRPWRGQEEAGLPPRPPAYDPGCYLCPENERAGGKRNPNYAGAFVFDNDFPALQPDLPLGEIGGGLLQAATERGVCRVVCFSPRHDLDIPQMHPADVRRVVDVWAEQTIALGSWDYIGHVQIFENRGAAMGASNPHPHCQIWASEHLPSEPAKEMRSLRGYLDRHRRCLLCSYLELEIERGERIVLTDEHFVVLVPFWAVWPFETMVLSRRHVPSLPDLADAERDALARALQGLITRYDRLFGVPFPYSMGFHQAPTDGASHPEAHLHAHYYPPLLRGATVRKFMVGYEMLANPQRDLTAESAAARLREVVGA